MTAATQKISSTFNSNAARLTIAEVEVLEGLARDPKQISPKYFYDQAGSVLFDAITQLDEYYVPRVERQIFTQHRDSMCAALGEGVALVEPGAGSCEKIKWLLPEFSPAVYVPMDISAEHLHESAAALSSEYPSLNVHPQVCDHMVDLELTLESTDATPVFFYPGSSIGNFEPAAAVEFMRDMRALMPSSGGLMIGVDAKKDPEVLHAAYNDAEGVTAQFNLNSLNNLNAQFDGTLDTDQFVHHALYNEAVGRIEMHLRCLASHTAELAGYPIEFEEGELVQTEYSYKYHPDEFIALAAQAGFAHRELWQDEQRFFSVLYFEPA